MDVWRQNNRSECVGASRWALALAPLLCALIVLFVGAGGAGAASVQEFARLAGQGETVLQGFGLVMGLPGTGDSGEDLVVARPLAELMRNQGAAVSSFEELSESKSVAIVMVTCVIPPEGARLDDKFDVIVTAINNPKSLKGGELFLTPLRGPLRNQSVYAIAQGPLEIEGENEARGRVSTGARMMKSIEMHTIAANGTISLIVKPEAAGWTTTQLLANVINDHRLGLDETAPDIARAVDERRVLVEIPQAELANPASFLSDVLSIRFDPSLLSLPAKVIVDARRGTIIVTADVEISPVIISHRNLVLTTVTPAIEPTDERPVVEQQRWARLGTQARPRDSARINDLINAFKQLDVAIEDQITILSKLHASGRLHAELVVNR